MAQRIPSLLRATRREIRRRSRLWSNYRYDYRRFYQHGSPFRDLDQEEQLLAYIWMLSHSLEKSLSLPDPAPGHGRDKLEMLLSAILDHVERHGVHPELSAVVGAVDEYLEVNASALADASDLRVRYEQIRGAIDTELRMPQWSGGRRTLTRREVWARARVDLEDFFCSRHSIRQFGSDPIDRKDIEWAVAMAQRSPSVCNRQSARVHVFDNDELGALVLGCQQGNRGFGHQADQILVITVDLRRFLSIGERNQCWIDGGMFAMSLVWALHSRGIGTCFLNWSAEKEQDEQLRKVAALPDWENVITLIAVGSLPERFSVASSPRRKIQDILVFRGRGDECDDE